MAGKVKFTLTYYNADKQVTQHIVNHPQEWEPSDDVLREAIVTILNYNRIVIPVKPYVTVHKQNNLLKTVQMQV